jgi:hypothetical protein
VRTVIWPYDQDLYPPAPVVDVRLGRPGESLAVGPLRAIVDTGADGSIAPSHYLESLRLPAVGEVYLRGQWDAGREAAVYRVDLGIGSLRLPSVEFVADELGDEVILGRNVLNKLVLSLDGPRQSLAIRA